MAAIVGGRPAAQPLAHGRESPLAVEPKMSTKPRESSRFLPRQRLMRVIGRPGKDGRLSPGQKTLLFFAMLLLLGALLAWLDPRPTLRHVNLAMLSGSTSGNYHATVDKLAAEVARQRGRIRNLSSAGSAENLQRLMAARQSCDIQFALVQDGTVPPDASGLELLGRLPQPESLIILGRNLERVRVPLDLVGMRIGIGPVGSGSEQLMQRLLSQLSELRLVVSTPTIDQQLDMLVRGELDLGAMVIDEGAALVRDAVVVRKLQILDMPDAPALARRLPFARPGTIEAGQIDYVHRLPPDDVSVLQMDTLIVGNGCAKNGATVGLLAAVSQVFPTFVQHNKGRPNLTGLPLSTVGANFLRDEGPDALGTYAPWAVDILPLPTWIQLGVALSVLFSGMAFGHRFNLWRIDAQRVRIEREIPALFHPGVTVGEIAEMQPDAAQHVPQTRARLDSLLYRLDALAERCRRKSLSILVPMGEEMSYRYQETLIAELQYALRLYRDRLPSAT
jgi:NMT1-like family